MELMEFGREILQAQPFSQLVGVELTRFETGHCELVLALEDRHLQHNGFVHGGVTSCLADMALTFAGGSVLGEVLTLEWKINFMRPGIGERMVARAEVLSSGATQAVCRCDIHVVRDGAEKACAAAQGTIARRPGAKTAPPEKAPRD